MKILLINPSSRTQRREHWDLKLSIKLWGLKGAFALPLALPTLAAATPSGHSVRIVDEEIEKVPLDAEVDLVGITAVTCKARRAYELADHYRKRGIRVVLGGVHASMLPEEAAQHADAVVVGEGERTWPEVVRDFAAGNPRQFYRNEGYLPATEVPVPRRDLIRNDRYFSHMLQTRRGCPNKCSFCCVHKVNGNPVRRKDMEQIWSELESMHAVNQHPMSYWHEGKKYRFMQLYVVDDNFNQHRSHAKDVCRTMIRFQEEKRVKIMWAGMGDMTVSEDPELISLMADSGCVSFLLGVESFFENALEWMNKRKTRKANSIDAYEACFQTLAAAGIDVMPSLIVGTDFEDDSVFDAVFEFYKRCNTFYALPHVLTPYPGTELRKQMEAEGRVLHENWDEYNQMRVTFKPKNMTPEALQAKLNGLYARLFNMDRAFEASVRSAEVIRPARVPKPLLVAMWLYYLIRTPAVLRANDYSWGDILRYYRLVYRLFRSKGLRLLGSYSYLFYFASVADIHHFSRIAERESQAFSSGARSGDDETCALPAAS